MALPANKIKKVKLPNNTEYEIIPSTLQDGTTNNKLSVPTLTNDDTIVTTNTTQAINGRKTFNNRIVANSGLTTDNDANDFFVTNTSDSGNEIYALGINANYDDNNNYIGTQVTAPGHFTAFGDNDDDDPNKPDDETGFSDLDTHYFNTGITVRDTNNDINYKMSFPAKNGVFATTSDIQNVEIVDLTQINS